jgi:hypothetical protein
MNKDSVTRRLDRRDFVGTCGVGIAAALLPTVVAAEEKRGGVLYPKRIETLAGKFSWHEAVVKNIPPLKHARGSRWPLIAWENFSTEPQRPEFYQALLARGIAEHIRLEPKQIDTALAIQRAGSPVIVLEGAGRCTPVGRSSRKNSARRCGSSSKRAW